MSTADLNSKKKMASKSQKFNATDALKEKRRKFVKAKLPKKPNPQSTAPTVNPPSETELLYSPLSAWYENVERLKPIKPLDEAAKIDPKLMLEMKEKARNSYEERVKTFDRGNYFLRNLFLRYYSGVSNLIRIASQNLNPVLN